MPAFNLNPDAPSTGLNFGQLVHRSRQPGALNQILLTANKPLDPKELGFHWGFKLQGMYGSDARYTQFLGELNSVDPDDRNQFDIVEANVLFHLPVLTAGGIDIKAGQYSTPLGYETIDPSTNPFYSHSYIFHFGLPFKHTGLLTVDAMSTTLLDLYAGRRYRHQHDRSVRWATITAPSAVSGRRQPDPVDGNLTILALTHMGRNKRLRVAVAGGLQRRRLLALSTTISWSPTRPARN